MSSDNSQEQLVHPPKSTSSVEITPLGYLNSYDAVVNKNYAFAVYKEKKLSSGDWYFKIKSLVTAGTSLDPKHSSFRKNISAAAVKGKNYCVFGFNLCSGEDDPRVVENRLYFDESLKPEYVEMHLVTRKADGSAEEEQVLKIDWPAEPKDNEEKQLIPLPKPSSSTEITQLGYLCSYDVPIDKDYAFLVYQEKNSSSGKWKIHIKGKVTAGTVLDPANPSLKQKLQKALSTGEKYLPFGFKLTPGENDPRLVENRIFFDHDAKPTHVEIHVITRNADNSAKEEQILSFDWPE